MLPEFELFFQVTEVCFSKSVATNISFFILEVGIFQGKNLLFSEQNCGSHWVLSALRSVALRSGD